MNVKQITMGIVATIVAIVIVVTCAIPIISDSVATEDTFTNEGYFRMSKITTDDDITIDWDYTEPYVFNVNDVDVTIPFGSTNPPIYPYSIISAGNWALRFLSTNAGAQIDLAIFGESTTLIWGTSTTDAKNLTITMSNGTASFTRTGDATPKTMPYTNAYVLDSDGDYTMKKGNESAYLLGDSVIYSVGRTGVTMGGVAGNFNANLNGTIDDGVTVTLIYPTTWTASNIVVHSSSVSGYEELYKFDNVTFDVTDESENTVSANYGQVIVPYEVTADRSVAPDTSVISILSVIPVMMVLAILIGAVGMFIKTRRD